MPSCPHGTGTAMVKLSQIDAELLTCVERVRYGNNPSENKTPINKSILPIQTVLCCTSNSNDYCAVLPLVQCPLIR